MCPQEKDNYTDLCSYETFQEVEVMKFDVLTSMVASSYAIYCI